MNKIIGKPAGGKPLSLDDLLTRLDARSKSIESNITTLNQQILSCKQIMKKHAQNAKSPIYLKERKKAHLLLKQRQIYDAQLSKLQNQQFNVQQQKFQLENLESAKEQAEAMRVAKKEAMKLKKKIDVDEVADLKFDNEMFGQDLDEVNEVLGEVSGINDDELLAELDDLDFEDVGVVDKVADAKAKTAKDKEEEALDDELLALEEDMLPAVPKNNARKKGNNNKVLEEELA